MKDKKYSNLQTSLSLVFLILSMSFLTFASSPIYNLFCKATGYGGTTQVASNASSYLGTKKLTIKFDANTDKKLPWIFIPKQKEISVISGENILVFYYAENLSKDNIIGTAIYNITPYKAGKYFKKIHCFCFEEQQIKANEKVLMPVTFFIDPAIDKDPALSNVNTITLSYSFYFIRLSNQEKNDK